MSKIKVLMISCLSLKGLYDGSIVRGVDTYEEKLKSHLLKRNDIEIHLIEIGRENKKFKKSNLFIHVIKKGRLANVLYFPVLLFKMNHKIRDINPDIIHVFSTGCIYGMLALILRKKYTSLVTAYGIIAKEAKHYRADYKGDFRKYYAHIFFTLPRKVYERYIFSKIPNVVVDSESIKELVNSWTNSKIYVVPAGVEYEKVKRIGRACDLNENPDIFFVNNLQKIKGADILIKSIPLVMDSFPDVCVYIAGIGPQENKLKTLVKELNLEKQVKFLGFISDKEKYQYYSTSKIVVIPSRWDCQPAAFFDAAALGKPVIASDMSNPGVLIDGKTGLIFKSENFEDLAVKIKILLGNEKMREDMGIKAQKNIAKYDWDEVAAHYFKIYKEIITNFNN